MWQSKNILQHALVLILENDPMREHGIPTARSLKISVYTHLYSIYRPLLVYWLVSPMEGRRALWRGASIRVFLASELVKKITEMQWDLQVQLLYKTASSDSLQSQLHISNGRVIKADLDLWNQIIHKENLDGS